MENIELDTDFVKKIILDNLKVQKKIVEQSHKIMEISRSISTSLRNGGKIFLFGNGGSAADSQHIAAELSGKFYNSNRPGLPAISLNSNVSSITAIANDFGYDKIFSRQLEGLLTPKDVVLGISTSGASPNVIKGIQKAKEIGALTISFTGYSGGKLAKISDLSICVPSEDTPRIQESHILIGHIICEIVEKDLFG